MVISRCARAGIRVPLFGLCAVVLLLVLLLFVGFSLGFCVLLVPAMSGQVKCHLNVSLCRWLSVFALRQQVAVCVRIWLAGSRW